MGLESLDAGIELEIFATVLARLFDYPVEQLTAKTTGSVAFTGDQIIDIEKLSRKERFEKPIAGDGANFVFRFKKRELVPFFLLTLNALDELLRLLKERPQFPHD